MDSYSVYRDGAIWDGLHDAYEDGYKDGQRDAYQWISVKDRLPNEDEIVYNSIGIDGERKVSDKVLAGYEDGRVLAGYFMKSSLRHEYHGKGKTNQYSRNGIATWEFGDYQMGWIVAFHECPTHWMPFSSLPPIPPSD